MAVNVNTNELPEKGKGADRKPETKFIKAGNRLARLVSYVELGKHFQMFQGKKAVYEQGKNAGRQKPPVLHCALTFEFPAEEYTGDYPLTISTSRRMQNGEFFDAVVVPPSLEDGTMSRAYAMRTRFMKYLTALQAATGLQYTNFADFARDQVGVMINVTNKKGAADEKTGVAPVYANMKPDGIVAARFEHPVSGEIEELEVPPAKGDHYCPAFEWDSPTKESWSMLPPWHKDAIKAAVDFAGSPIDMLLQANPELDKINEPDEDQDQTPNTPAEPPRDPAEQEDIPV
jgi:hypothetical protein